jgi:hypothetical protein
MQYSEITHFPRYWNSNQFPFLAHVVINATEFGLFEELAADQTQLRVLGHDLAANGQVIVHVGCTTKEARELLESRWA